MTTITLSLDNFENFGFGLSKTKKAKDSDTNFYWILVYNPNGDVDYFVATCKEFTSFLGDNADDDKLVDTILAHDGEFEITNITNDNNEPVYFKDGTPIYGLRRRAHRKILKRA